MAFFGFFGFFLVSCAYGEFLSFWTPCCAQDLGYIGVPPAGHALWAEVGGGITFVTSGEKYSTKREPHKTADKYPWDMCMVYWTYGASEKLETMCAV